MGRRTILLISALVVAALGTALVFLYVQSADDRAAAGQEQVEVLFATQQIPVGQSAETASTNGSLELRTVAANSVAEGALSDIDPIANQVALTTIFPGQQIVSAAFGDVTGVSAIPIPDDKMALSLQLGDPERVAGFLGRRVRGRGLRHAAQPLRQRSGERVDGRADLVAHPARPGHHRGQRPARAQTTTTTSEGDQNTEEIPRAIVTLAVDQEEAQRLIYASQKGQLYFTLLTETSKVGTLPPTNGVNISK